MLESNMPVFVNRDRDPFRGEGLVSHRRTKTKKNLRVPQARVLSVLIPADPSTPPTEWPSFMGRYIARKLGTSEVSDYVRRAMRGLRMGSPSGTSHLGLLAKGYATEYELDIDGVTEIYYQITADGIAALTEYLKDHELPVVRNPESCTNSRYKK